jgi:hypothetical protein
MLRTDDKRLLLVCRFCYNRKDIDAGRSGIYETTNSTLTTPGLCHISNRCALATATALQARHSGILIQDLHGFFRG